MAADVIDDAPAALWVIDLGNTRVKIGRFEGGALAEVDSYERGRRGEGLARVLAATPAPCALLATGRVDEEAEWRERLGERAEVWSYTPGGPAPLTVAYATPETLGADRLAAAAGAQALYPGRAALVVDVGTCVTYELVDADAVYRGGAISPGPAMRLDAMHRFTGRLPRPPVAAAPGFPANSTTAALLEGAVGGTAREVGAYAAEFSRLHPRGVVLGCGGGFALLRPSLPAGILYRPHLVLEGLATLYAYAQLQ